MHVKRLVVIVCLLLASKVHAQVSTGGVLLLVPATGAVTHVNDEATLTFTAQESGRDKGATASLVHKKMKQGAEIVRAQDGTAKLTTLNYTTSPVYKKVKGTSSDSDEGEGREIIGWRVEQSLTVTTKNLPGLPKMVAAAQGVLGLGNIDFHLSEAVGKALDDERIVATYQNLNERIASLAKAMGRKVGDATLESVDLEGGAGAASPENGFFYASKQSGVYGNAKPLTEPSFEPGETTLQMRLVGKVKFK